MGGVGKVISGKRVRLCRCRLSSKSWSVSPLSATASRRLFTSGGLARCNKWPAAEESRLRQKRDAEPFLLRRARHFLRRRQQCPSPLREGSARCLSLLACILFTRRERRMGCPPIASHVQSVHGLIESQAHYFLLPLTPSLPPRSPSPSLPFLSVKRTDCVGLPVM